MLSLMTRPRLLALCAVVCLALSGCDRQQIAHWLAPTDEDAIGRQYVEDIRERNFTPLQKDLAPGVDVPDAALMSLALFLNAGETPKSVTIVTRNVSTGDGVTHYDLGYEYAFAKDLRLIELNLVKVGAVTKIAGLHTYAITVPLNQVNAFRLSHKSPQHFAFLAAWVLMALFTLGTAIACWRTPMGGAKPLWLLIILLGFCEIAINWTTGTIYYDLMALEIFAVGFSRDLSGIWTLQIGFPLGAILFWVCRKSLKTAA
jgi:hypothetical protein